MGKCRFECASLYKNVAALTKVYLPIQVTLHVPVSMSSVEKESLLAEEAYTLPPPDDGLYIPGPPPDYLAALNMDEYGPPGYEDPAVQGIGKGMYPSRAVVKVCIHPGQWLKYI